MKFKLVAKGGGGESREQIWLHEATSEVYAISAITTLCIISTFFYSHDDDDD